MMRSTFLLLKQKNSSKISSAALVAATKKGKTPTANQNEANQRSSSKSKTSASTSSTISSAVRSSSSNTRKAAAVAAKVSPASPPTTNSRNLGSNNGSSPRTTSPPPPPSPQALILTAAYRACLKELQRALQLHQGNTTHIVKAIFGPLMDMETLRRAALVRGMLTQPAHAFDETLRPKNIKVVLPGALRIILGQQQSDAAAAKNNGNAATEKDDDDGDESSIIGQAITDVFAEVLDNVFADMTNMHSQRLKDEGGEETINKKKRSGSKNKNKNAAVATATPSSRSRIFFHHHDGEALANVLRLFFESPLTVSKQGGAVEGSNLLFAIIPGADEVAAATTTGTSASGQQGKKKPSNVSASSSSSFKSHDEVVADLLRNPQIQAEMLTKAFEFIKRLREATSGFPRPQDVETSVPVTGDNGTDDSKATTATKANKDTSSSSDFSKKVSQCIEISPPIQESASVINQCLQIVSQYTHPLVATARKTEEARKKNKEQVNKGGGDAKDDEQSKLAKEEEAASHALVQNSSVSHVRALFSRIGFPHPGHGDIETLKHLCIPSDPFHVNNLTTDKTVPFAAELAVIEAMAALTNQTRDEILLLAEPPLSPAVNKKAEEEKGQNHNSITEQKVKRLFRIDSTSHGPLSVNGVKRRASGEKQDDKNANNTNSTKEDEESDGRGLYHHITAYARATPGSLLHVIPRVASAIVGAEADKTAANTNDDNKGGGGGGGRAPLTTAKSLLAPSTMTKKNLFAQAAEYDKAKSKKDEGEKKNTSTATAITSDDILEEVGSLAALNSEFGGVRAPFTDAEKVPLLLLAAPTTTATATPAAGKKKLSQTPSTATPTVSPSCPLISLPRPIDSDHGASLFTFKELFYLRPDLPWYQCAAPSLYYQEKSGGNGATTLSSASAVAPLATATTNSPSLSSVGSVLNVIRSKAAEYLRRNQFTTDLASTTAISSASSSCSPVAERHLYNSIAGVVAQIPTTTTTITNGIISITVSTVYAGIQKASSYDTVVAQRPDSTSLSPAEYHEQHMKAAAAATPMDKHVFQYRITITNISGGNGGDDATASPTPPSPPPTSPLSVSQRCTNRIEAEVKAQCERNLAMMGNTKAVGVKVTVISRHWAFIDAVTKQVKEVVGPGLVGNSPRLAPGESFSYDSATYMSTPFGGYMRGSFQCVSMADNTDTRLVESLEAKRVLADHYERERRIKAAKEASVAAEGKERGGKASEAAAVRTEDETLDSEGRNRTPPSSTKRTHVYDDAQPLFTNESVEREVEALLARNFRATQSSFDAAIGATALRKV